MILSYSLKVSDCLGLSDFLPFGDHFPPFYICSFFTDQGEHGNQFGELQASVLQTSELPPGPQRFLLGLGLMSWDTETLTFSHANTFPKLPIISVNKLKEVFGKKKKRKIYISLLLLTGS